MGGSLAAGSRFQIRESNGGNFMKNLRTLSMIVAGMLLAVPMLQGCGEETVSTAGGESQASTQSQTGENSTAEEGPYQKGDYTLPISEEGVTLRWMGRDSEDAGTSFTTGKSIIWDEIQKQTNITIEWDVIPNQEYQQVMQIRLSSKTDLPDIICIQGQSDGSTVSKYYDEEVLYPLNDLIADYAPNLQQVFEDYPEYKDTITLPNGDIPAIASEVASSPYRASCMIIRQDWLDKLNLESPKNVDELYDVAKAFMENDPNGNGEADEFGIMANGYKAMWQIGMGFGLSLMPSNGWQYMDGELTYAFTTPEYKEYLTWMNKAYNDGLFPSDFQTADGNIYQQRIANNTLGILGRDGVKQFIDLNDPEKSTQQNNPGSLWRPIIFEADETHKLVVPSEPLASIWRSFGITQNCTDKVAAIRLFDYLVAGEGRTLNNYGIEGLTYNMVNGVPVSTEAWKETAEPGEFLGGGYSPSMKVDTDYMGFMETKYLKDDPEMMEWSLGLLDRILEDVTVPYQASLPSVEDSKRLSSIYAELNTYRDEMYMKFITGEASLDAYDEYVENCKKLGCDEIKEIYTK